MNLITEWLRVRRRKKARRRIEETKERIARLAGELEWRAKIIQNTTKAPLLWYEDTATMGGELALLRFRLGELERGRDDFD